MFYKIQLLWAKLTGKTTILFSKKKNWKGVIKAMLKRQKNISLFFYEFDQVDTANFDYVIPLTVHAQQYANQNKLFNQSNQALISPQKSIEICDKKDKFEEFMLKNGFEQYYPLAQKTATYPYVIKKVVDEFGLNTKIIKNKEDEQKYADLITSKDYIKQAYITGKEEYAAHIILKDNKIIYLNTLAYVFEEDIFVKGKYYKEKNRIKVNHEHFTPIFQEILTKMEYKEGICCFNYKLENGIMQIFEINPRFGGSLLQYIDKVLPIYRKAVEKKEF